MCPPDGLNEATETSFLHHSSVYTVNTPTKEKKYKCIAKVGNEKFVKYRLSNLISFANFLDRAWKDWRWFNVYDKRTGEQLANYTRKNRPTSKHL